MKKNTSIFFHNQEKYSQVVNLMEAGLTIIANSETLKTLIAL
jgi:hypothetical protein